MGAQESATRKTLRRLKQESKLEGREALAQLAVGLSRTLDEGAGLAVAAVSRELRATLAALEAVHDGGDDDLNVEFRRMFSKMGDPPGS